MKLAFLAALAWVTLAPPLEAQATAYLPTLDPAYADVDALVASGWVRDAILAVRPYSRLTMARFAAGARRGLGADSVGSPRPRLVEALERLEARLEPELAALADGVVDPRPGRVGTSIRLGVERVNGLDFDPTLSRFNGLAQLRFEVRPW